MNVKQIYKLAVKIGMENDFRTKTEMVDHLKREQEKFKGLSKEEKIYFDQEKLTNPYADSRIHHDNGKEVIKKVLVGIQHPRQFSVTLRRPNITVGAFQYMFKV